MWHHRECSTFLGFLQETSRHSPLQTYSCVKCHRDFRLEENPPGNCVHTGTWHWKYEDCSYLKCGFQLAKQVAIGSAHWSCCYSLDRHSTMCSNSHPHTFLKARWNRSILRVRVRVREAKRNKRDETLNERRSPCSARYGGQPDFNRVRSGTDDPSRYMGLSLVGTWDACWHHGQVRLDSI